MTLMLSKTAHANQIGRLYDITGLTEDNQHYVITDRRDDTRYLALVNDIDLERDNVALYTDNPSLSITGKRYRSLALLRDLYRSHKGRAFTGQDAAKVGIYWSTLTRFTRVGYIVKAGTHQVKYGSGFTGSVNLYRFSDAPEVVAKLGGRE